MRKYPDFPLIDQVNGESIILLWNPVAQANQAVKLKDLKAYFGVSSGTSPTNNEKNLTYISDGDANGIFYYIGTNKNTQNWTNPVTANRVNITQSSAYDSNHANVASLVDRQNSNNFCSANTAGFYFDIDLKMGNSLILAAYSLKGRNWSADHPRSWKIQGSNGSNLWVDLDTKSGITSINQNSWYTSSVNSSTAYQLFRFLSTGVSSSGYNIICLGEIELYGKLLWN